MNNNLDFSDISKSITKSLDNKYKKQHGIYFSPPKAIKELFGNIINHKQFKNVLEPSCGSCEFIKYLNSIKNDINIDCVELDKKIFNTIDKINFNTTNSIQLFNQNFLEYNTEKMYDLICGNPPYFVLKKKMLIKNIINL